MTRAKSKTLDTVAQDRAKAGEDLRAQRDALRASLLSLVRLVRGVGGYMTPEHQRALAAAERLLADVAAVPVNGAHT